jgi:hypothetical protein
VHALIDLSFDPVHGNISTGSTAAGVSLVVYISKNISTGFEESITEWATFVLRQVLEVGSIL